MSGYAGFFVLVLAHNTRCVCAPFARNLSHCAPEKDRRLRRAAEAFLARNSALTRLEVAFEVAAVRGRRIERVPLG